MNLEEYTKLDATGLAELIKNKEVSASEVEAVAREAIAYTNQELNFLAKEIEPIRGASDGPLAGVPTLAKDIGMWIKGVSVGGGSRFMMKGKLTPPVNSELFNRIRKSGLDTIGITTTPEMGFNGTSEAIAYNKPTRNPWDLTRSSGGSSGGAGAAVASGAVPVAHANDGGGSIRIPAAACGVLGLKPSRGRLPSGPNVLMPLLGFATEFMITRTIRDSALLLDLTQGVDSGSYYSVLKPEGTYMEAIQQQTQRKRIAFTTHLKGTPKPTKEMEDALRKLAQKLESMGHIVEEASPDYDYETWYEANFTLWCCHLAAIINTVSKNTGIKPEPELLETATFSAYEAGQKFSGPDIFDALSKVNVICRSVGAFMDQYDALLLPTLPGPAHKLGVLNQNETGLTADAWHEKLFKYIPYTAQFNMTGQPSINIPCQPEGELPLGAQIIGRMYDEQTCLQLAHDLEKEANGFTINPEIHASQIELENA